MKFFIACICLLLTSLLHSQVPVNLKNFSNKNGVNITNANGALSVTWPSGKGQSARVILDLDNFNPLIKGLGNVSGSRYTEVASELDPKFLLTVGKRDLVSQNGWNIFFDKVPLKPFQSHLVEFKKDSASVRSFGSRTVVSIGKLSAPGFDGHLELTFFNGSPLFNIAAVISTLKDSTAILYDAGLVAKELPWKNIAFSDVYEKMQQQTPTFSDTAINQAVKYRTILGETEKGSVAVFPAPHQYFYPLDEAFNLKFGWHGNQYRKMIDGYGIGIRQDLYGDRRFVPWFNAPPGTDQRLNFFCYVSDKKPNHTLEEIKRFTNGDAYAPLEGYKRMASHFHNEYIMNVVLANKPVPAKPSFVKVFEDIGIDIVHLGEFHYTAHPLGPDSLRLKELKALFDMCVRFSNDKFLLLPGEEPNEFFGGHWLQIFPKPVYWIMSRKKDQPFVTNDPQLGKIYRVGNAKEMLDLLNQEKGLAWTAHPRTKGSTGFPDKYKNESFFLSDRFLGGAWKPMPADLSIDRLGVRVLDLLDDMNNWGLQKKIIAEADLFTIEPENEMYAHMNVNYLLLDKLPSFNKGWQPVVDAMQKGKFFSSTGEVLLPSFTINGKSTGETALLNNKKARVNFSVNWTFPLQYAMIISGDGKKTYRHRINLDHTVPFGKKQFSYELDLSGRTWARLEVWDAAVNGAFTQTIYLQ